MEQRAAHQILCDDRGTIHKSPGFTQYDPGAADEGMNEYNAQMPCPICGAYTFFDKGDAYNDPFWECSKGHGTFTKAQIDKLLT